MAWPRKPIAPSTAVSTASAARKCSSTTRSRWQFGYTKVRYRGLAKNTAQVLTLFALSNLWIARRRLLLPTG